MADMNLQIKMKDTDQINELVGEGGYNYNLDDYDPLLLWDQPWFLLSEDEQNYVREQLRNKAKQEESK